MMMGVSSSVGARITNFSYNCVVLELCNRLDENFSLLTNLILENTLVLEITNFSWTVMCNLDVEKVRICSKQEFVNTS